MAPVTTDLDRDTVRAHLATTWRLAEHALAAFAAHDAGGLPTVLADRLGREMDTARTALRERSFTASRDRTIAAWLPEALELAELANLLVRTCAHTGRSGAAAPDDLEVPEQVARLAAISPGLASARVALELARAALAVPESSRFAISARELVTTTQLHLATADTPRPWSVSVLHVVERLLDQTGPVGASVPAAVAEVVAPRPLAIVVVDPSTRPGDGDPVANVPGLDASAVTASRAAGRWSVPARTPTDGDRLVVHLPPDRIGPLRAAARDPEAAASPLPRSQP